MYWLIGAAAVTVGVSLLAWLSGEEQSAYNSYLTSSERLASETKLRQQQMAASQARYRSQKDYYKHIELHFASMKTASALYEQYETHKKMVAMFQNKQHSFSRCIINLKQQRDTAIGIKKSAIKAQLDEVRAHFQEAKAQLARLKQEKTKLLDEIRQLNAATHDYKLYIRDNCGQKGRNWYQRGLERKQQRLRYGS